MSKQGPPASLGRKLHPPTYDLSWKSLLPVDVPRQPRTKWDRYRIRYPKLMLIPAPERAGDLDPDISLAYCRRFFGALGASANQPLEILREFFTNNYIEFEFSGWVRTAVGLLVLGCPDKGQSAERQAHRFVDHYWRSINSPKLKKLAAKLSAASLMKSPHRKCWTRVVIWTSKTMETYSDSRAMVRRYFEAHPNRCKCLTEAIVMRLIDATIDDPPTVEPSQIVRKVIAEARGMSESTLAHFAPKFNAKKRPRKLHNSVVARQL